MNALLYSILSIPSESGDCAAMTEFITSHCQARGWQWRLDESGNIYVTAGQSDSYPCAVAHLDTVHAIEEGGIRPVEIDGAVTGINPTTMQQTGIGGDDKCGIFAALVCLESLPACKAAFFIDEEVGCRGSHAADLAFFRDCRYALQADRRGSSDFVMDINGPLASKAFRKAVRPHLKAFGFTPCRGMMTDVEALRDGGIGISVANMSAGYYQPHTDGEYIDLADLENTVELMLDIMRHETRAFPFTYSRPVLKAAFTWPEYTRSRREPFPDYSGGKSWGTLETWDDIANVCHYCGWDARRPEEREGCEECQHDIDGWRLSNAAERHLTGLGARI